MNLNKILNNHLVKPIAQVASSQIILQGLGFLISIILIRLLPKDDYALYTIYISIQGILLIMSDSGLSIGFKAIGARVWQDNLRMASLIKTASSLRWKVVLLALFVCFCYSGFILIKQGFNYNKIILFFVIMLGIIIPEVQKGFFINALLLKNEISIVQITSLIGQGTRLLIIGFIVLFFKDLLNVELVLIITVISVWTSYVYLLKKSVNLRNHDSKINNSFRKILLKYFKLNYHTTVFYAFQGQISIFLIGVFGSTSDLAGLGALTRFSLIFSVLNALVYNILGPSFAKEGKKSVLKNIFFKTMLVLMGLSVFIFMVVYLFPEPFLWILGDKYKNLSFELLLVFVSGILGFISATVFTLNSSKGWIAHTPIWEIPLSLLAIIAGLMVFNVNTLQGVLFLSITSSIVLLLLYLANLYTGFKRIKQ